MRLVWLQILTLMCLYGVLIPTSVHVSEHVPAPYMDEIFHVPQAQAYCAGRFVEWNSKITTLPGLYVVSASLAWWMGDAFCQLSALRGLNALFALLLCTVLLRIDNGRRGVLAVLADVASPTIAFFHFLYYTDTGALLFVMLAYWLAVCERRRGWAAAVGAAAVLFRQTNIVWIALVAAIAVLDEFDASADLLPFAAHVTRNLPHLIARNWPFVALAGAFAAFVVQNGAIVVGDKSNHEPARHFAQLAYAAVFVYAHVAVAVLQWRHVAQLRHRWLSLVLTALALGALVHRFSEPHAFLLADNRHYTFYLWRRVLDRHGALGRALLLGPLASVALHLLYAALRDARRGSAFFALVALATAAAVVPSPLLEPRYFSVPLLLVRTHLPPPASVWRSALETALFVAAAAASIVVFVHYPFGADQQQRFMW